MRLLLQKLPLSHNTSFVARTYRTPAFEVPWHHHEELELIYFTEGAGMCFIPAFCKYFKACTKKTYINFLNEIRIGYACKLLTDTQKQARVVCFESGFGTLTNFHKQFVLLKNISPHQYRTELQKRV